MFRRVERFIISSIGREHFLMCFIELEIIILIREIAVATMAANMKNVLMVSIGVVLLVVVFRIAREKINVPRDRGVR